MSTTTPPPMVTTGENMRMMKRSPGKQQRRLAQDQAHVRGSARPHRGGALQQAHLGLDLRRAGMKVDGGAVLQGLGRGKQVEAAIDLRHGLEAAGLAQHVAARQVRRARYRPG